jgi:hypothetical protein
MRQPTVPESGCRKAVALPGAPLATRFGGGRGPRFHALFQTQVLLLRRS